MKKFDIKRINIYTIARDLFINLWVIVLAAIVGLVGSVSYYTYLHKHSYVSTMTVSINLSGYTTNATALSLARTVVIAETLEGVLGSQAVCDVVRRDIGGEITGTISAHQLGETNLISISVTDSSPEKAYETLVSVYKNYPLVTDYVFNNVIISTIVNPTMPKGPSNPISTTALGLICGFMAALIVTVLVILVSYLRDTVKNISDVEDELNAKLFGVVYHVKGINPKLPAAKRRLSILNPLVGFEFSNSFRKMAVKTESLKRTKGAKTFMITSVTENEGKTSASVNLALALAQNGHKTLLLDCDFKNPSVHRFFDKVNRTEDQDFHKYLDNGGMLENFIKHDTDSGLYLVDNINFCTQSAEKLTSRRFSETVKQLKSMFDYVIIDTPPCGITVDAEIVSGSVDASFMVVRQDVVEVTDINDHIENLSKCYFAGCIFNDVAVLNFKKQTQDDSFMNYYSRQDN